MRISSLLLLLVASSAVLTANAANCEDGVMSIYANYGTTVCGQLALAMINGLSSVVTDPAVLADGGFVGIVNSTSGVVLDFDFTCPYCADNFTTIIEELYSAGDEDEFCSLVAGGLELLCVKDSINDLYCGGFDIPNVCTLDETCCLPAFKSFLTYASSSVSTLATFAAGTSYTVLCAGLGKTTPALGECVFLDGQTPVTTDFDWRVDFDCNSDEVTAVLDTIKTDEDVTAEFTTAEITACFDRIKAITDQTAYALAAAEDDLVSFSNLCEDCTLIVSKFIEGVEALADSTEDLPCYIVSGVFDFGCLAVDSTYCGTFYLTDGGETCDSKTSDLGCCVAAYYDYLSDVLTASDVDGASETLTAISAGLAESEICGITATDLAAGIPSTCALTDILDETGSGDDAAFAVSMQSIMSVIAASIALAFLLVA